VKSMYNTGGCRKAPFERLEPDVGKLASPVLRGRGGGNIALLPGRREPVITDYLYGRKQDQAHRR